MRDCTVTVEAKEGYAIARVSGDLVLEATDAWLPVVENAVNEPDARLVIDLSQAKGIDSGALNRLVALVASANTRSCRVLFAAPPPFVAGVFEVTRLNTFLEVCETVAEAEARLAGSS